MNIFEALNSGKPFRRKDERWQTEWYTAEAWLKGYLLKGVLDEENQEYLILDLKANDWVLRPDPIAIHPEQFWAATVEALKSGGSDGNPAKAMEHLAIALGFKSL